MTEQSWAISYWFERLGADPELTDLVQRLVVCRDADQAESIASRVELEVAPPRGGLGPEAESVHDYLSVCLPFMAASARPAALGLMGQLCGSLLAAGPDRKWNLSRSLSTLVGLVQVGDADLRAEFVDYAAMCAALDGELAAEVSFYLRRIAEEGGAVGASAERELRELA